MCGIAGVLSWGAPIDARAVRTMLAALVHRGPDDEGLVERRGVALGNRRLAVIDLSAAAHQPMSDHSGQYWITYNGEIYNFSELRSELQGYGAVFRSRSDTEVVIEAYKQWGTACLERLNGMFAFALWDDRQQRLFLARDRLGEKPLYYAPVSGHGLVFASELTALLKHPLAPTAVDGRAVAQFLALNYTLTSACMIGGVQKLPPAHFVVASPDERMVGGCYWNLHEHFADKSRHRSETEAAEECRDLVDAAVKSRIVSDVPVGVFLSGGLDSSAVTAAIARTGQADRIRAFSVGFPERRYNELPAAIAVAQTLGVRLDTEAIGERQASQMLAHLSTFDEPVGDTAILPTHCLSALARQHVTVCLSGDGGDEIMAGYPTYVADRIRHATRWVPPRASAAIGTILNAILPVSRDKLGLDFKLRQFFAKHALDGPRAHSAWREIFSPAERRKLLRPEWHQLVGDDAPYDEIERHFHEVRSCDLIDQAMYVDMKTWLVNDILVKSDRVTMAHSLECRAPLLEHKLVEFAASLPTDWKLRGLRTKHIFKESQRGRLPQWVIDRPKSGFTAPVAHWLDGEFGRMAEAAMSEPGFAAWFEPSAIRELWQDHRTGRRENSYKLFGLTCLAMWLARSRTT